MSEELEEKPVAWRIRIGASDMWGYCSTKEEADFHGKASGLKYLKEPLYSLCAMARMESRLADSEKALGQFRAAIIAMGEDGWLYFGPEGMSKPQELCMAAYKAAKGL